MPTTKLGTLLDAMDVHLETEGLVLKDPVGETAGSRATLTVGPARGPLRVLGDLVELDAGATARLHVIDGGVPSPFDPDHDLTPPQGTTFVDLSLEASASAEGRAKVPVDAVVLTLGADASAHLHYRHLAAFRSGLQLRTTIRRLVKGARTPADAARDLTAAELHSLTTDFSLDLGLAAKIGARVDLGYEPFASISEPLQVRFDATLKAALGLTLDDEMQLTVGRLDLLNPGWVRVQLRRVHQSRLTLGATFALKVKYDLASPFLGLLDEALAAQPFVRLRSAVDQLSEVGELAAAIEAGDWVTARTMISDAAVEVVGDLVGVDDLWAWLENDTGAGEVLAAVRRLVDGYDRWIDDERLQSLWERLLGRVDLAPGTPLRKALEEVARLDPDDLDATLEQVLEERWRHAIDLLEILAGCDLEELLQASDEAREALDTAVRLARASLRLFEDTPTWLLEQLRDLAQRTGIAKAVEQLRHVSSVEALQETTHTMAANLVSRLLGRALDGLDEDDLAAIRSWAAELGDVLDAARLERLDAVVRQTLHRLEGEAGFSVGVEIDRLSRTSSVVDIEVEPALLARLSRHLASGSITDLLEGLFASDDAGDDEPPFLIRDCVFTSRRVRSSAVSVLLSLIGWNHDRRRRVLESWLRVAHLDDGRVERRSRFSGALVAFHKDADRTSVEAGTWLTLRGKARESRLDLDGPYATVDPELRVSLTRRDPGSTAAEMVAIDALLFDLGFVSTFNPERPVHTGAVPHRSPTRLGVSLRFGEGAVAALLSEIDDQPGWDTDVLNAAHRWFDERLAGSLVAHTPVREGDALATVVRSRPYVKDWRVGRAVFEHRYRNGFVVSLAGHRVRLAPLARYPALVTVQTARAAAPGRLREVAALLSTPDGRTSADLLEAVRAMATAMKRLSPVGWPNPMFLPWLVVARLTRLAPEELAAVRGTATLRWQENDEWFGPPTLKLDAGIPHHALGASVFPFSNGEGFSDPEPSHQ